jgi:RNA ligase
VTDPSAYPRIPHLTAGRGTKDDRVLESAKMRSMLSKPVLVEEKLDGANVALWAADHRVECSLRSGPSGIDRARQLGPLRAWVAQRTGALYDLLADGSILYAEWLYLTHTVHYTLLPNYLIALDVRQPNGSFLLPDERTQVCGEAHLSVPPELWRGVLENAKAIESMIGSSCWANDTAEGVIVRTLDGSEPRIAKLLRPNFTRVDNASWKRARPRNRLADQEASWH